MIKALLFSSLLFLSSAPLVVAPTDQDAQRTTALDAYWKKLSKTVAEGDFEGYASLYHKDAVVVFATRPNKVSVAVAEALAGWKDGFAKTKAGERSDFVEFRFSQRIGSNNTAHETGIFHFGSKDKEGNLTVEDYIHFEMLFVKQNGKWLGLMEYQKSKGTKEEWEALK